MYQSLTDQATAWSQSITGCNGHRGTSYPGIPYARLSQTPSSGLLLAHHTSHTVLETGREWLTFGHWS